MVSLSSQVLDKIGTWWAFHGIAHLGEDVPDDKLAVSSEQGSAAALRGNPSRHAEGGLKTPLGRLQQELVHEMAHLGDSFRQRLRAILPESYTLTHTSDHGPSPSTFQYPSDALLLYKPRTSCKESELTRGHAVHTIDTSCMTSPAHVGIPGTGASGALPPSPWPSHCVRKLGGRPGRIRRRSVENRLNDTPDIFELASSLTQGILGRVSSIFPTATSFRPR